MANFGVVTIPFFTVIGNSHIEIVADDRIEGSVLGKFDFTVESVSPIAGGNGRPTVKVFGGIGRFHIFDRGHVKRFSGNYFDGSNRARKAVTDKRNGENIRIGNEIRSQIERTADSSEVNFFAERIGVAVLVKPRLFEIDRPMAVQRFIRAFFCKLYNGFRTVEVNADRFRCGLTANKLCCGALGVRNLHSLIYGKIVNIKFRNLSAGGIGVYRDSFI